MTRGIDWWHCQNLYNYFGDVVVIDSYFRCGILLLHAGDHHRHCQWRSVTNKYWKLVIILIIIIFVSVSITLALFGSQDYINERENWLQKFL